MRSRISRVAIYQGRTACRRHWTSIEASVAEFSVPACVWSFETHVVCGFGQGRTRSRYPLKDILCYDRRYYHLQLSKEGRTRHDRTTLVAVHVGEVYDVWSFQALLHRVYQCFVSIAGFVLLSCNSLDPYMSVVWFVCSTSFVNERKHSTFAKIRVFYP